MFCMSAAESYSHQPQWAFQVLVFGLGYWVVYLANCHKTSHELENLVMIPGHILEMKSRFALCSFIFLVTLMNNKPARKPPMSMKRRASPAELHTAKDYSPPNPSDIVDQRLSKHPQCPPFLSFIRAFKGAHMPRPPKLRLCGTTLLSRFPE